MTDRIIMLGDVLESLRDFPDNSFDACLCDPPYGIAFMGKKWDYDVPTTETWAEVFRVLKPGAPLVAFFGTRTYHRGVVRIEDAGFEIRDCLAWMYGQGFPKSMDVAKEIDKRAGHWRGRAGAVSSDNHAMGGPNYERTAKGAPVTAEAAEWDGYGTALKPAFEPAVLARKPLDGTVIENVAKWGCGALNIDGSRIDMQGETVTTTRNVALGSSSSGIYGAANTPGVFESHDAGRWPANVMLDEEAGAALDEQTGNRPGMSGGGVHKQGYPGGMFGGIDGNSSHARNDAGGASRFFQSISCDSASIAKQLSSDLRNPLSDFARSVAAILPSLEASARNPSSFRALSTAVMQSGSVLSDANSIESILSTVERFSFASKLTSTLLEDLAESAEPNELTDIITITESLLTCGSCVERAMSSFMRQSSEPGEQGSRFRYCAKVSKAEREAGCAALDVRTGAEITGRAPGSAGLDNPRSGAGGQGKARNHHPTLKPLALTRWLASLIKPPTADATLLVPFAGAGSEMIGAMQAGWPVIVGIERDPEYVGIAEARLAHWATEEEEAA